MGGFVFQVLTAPEENKTVTTKIKQKIGEGGDYSYLINELTFPDYSEKVKKDHKRGIGLILDEKIIVNNVGRQGRRNSGINKLLFRGHADLRVLLCCEKNGELREEEMLEERIKVAVGLWRRNIQCLYLHPTLFSFESIKYEGKIQYCEANNIDILVIFQYKE